ncbi:hypothetical protein AB5N19_06228 [Seiridium cardinale]
MARPREKPLDPSVVKNAADKPTRELAREPARKPARTSTRKPDRQTTRKPDPQATRKPDSTRTKKPPVSSSSKSKRRPRPAWSSSSSSSSSSSDTEDGRHNRRQPQVRSVRRPIRTINFQSAKPDTSSVGQEAAKKKVARRLKASNSTKDAAKAIQEYQIAYHQARMARMRQQQTEMGYEFAPEKTTTGS